MTVWTQKSKVLGSIVIVSAIDVVDLEPQRRTEPLKSNAARRARLRYTDLDKGTPKKHRVRAVGEFRLLDQYLSGRLSLPDLAAVVGRAPEVGGIETELTNSVRNV